MIVLGIINFKKIQDFKTRSNDTMVPGLSILNTTTAVCVGEKFGEPYSAAIIGLISLLVLPTLAEIFKGLLDWFDRCFLILAIIGNLGECLYKDVMILKRKRQRRKLYILFGFTCAFVFIFFFLPCPYYSNSSFFINKSS
jgi:hypothetical protein